MLGLQKKPYQMESSRKTYLNPTEILAHRHRPLYFLILRSEPIKSGNFRPRIEASGYTTLQIVQRGTAATKKQRISPIASIYVPGQGEWNNYVDGTGERENGEFLYIFLHRLDANFFVDQAERRNKCDFNSMIFDLKEKGLL